MQVVIVFGEVDFSYTGKLGFIHTKVCTQLIEPMQVAGFSYSKLLQWLHDRRCEDNLNVHLQFTVAFHIWVKDS